MAKPFKNLTDKMSPESRERAKAKTQAMLKEMPLHELRNARSLTQKQMAESMNIKQASVSKMEKRTDIYISTLKRFINAMGGHLDITAHFPDGSVKITSFGELDETVSETSHDDYNL